MYFIYQFYKGRFQKNGLYVFSIFACLFMLGCAKRNTSAILTSREWHIQKTEFPNANEQNSSLSPYKLIKFYPNQRYIMWSNGYFTTGIWNWLSNNEVIHLKPTYGQLDIIESFWKIEKFNEKELVVDLYRSALKRETNKEMTMTFDGKENISDKDPYSITANLWRKKSDKVETDAQLKNRTIGYLKFLGMVYKHALDNKETEIDFNWFPQPLRMQYRNGVRMAYNDELNEWNDCFFDSAQSVHAYQIVGNAMYDTKLKATDNLAERNLDLVQQMIGHLK